MAATGSYEPGHGLPSSVRSCPEPGLDPIEDVVPIVLNLIIVGTSRAVVAGSDPVNEAGKDNVFFILAGCIVFIKLLSVHQEVMGAHRGDEQWDCNILKRARRRVIGGAPVDLFIIKRVR